MSEPIRTGPRPDLDNRGRILEAARTAFSEKGYSGTTIRMVANLAGVDVALVPYYFGKKQELFAATMNQHTGADQKIDAAFEGGADQVGERITRAALELWESPTTRPALLTMLRSATTHEDSRQALSEFVSKVVLQAYIRHINGPDAERRAALASSHIIGVVMTRHVIRVEPIASWDFDQLVADLAPGIQRYLVDDVPE